MTARAEDAVCSKLSIVMPFFEEELQAAATLDAFQRCCSSLVEQGMIGSFELVCVNDGSSDGTAAILEQSHDGTEIRVVTHPVNRGLGAAVRSGISAATGDIILYTDADLPFEVECVSEGLEFFKTQGIDVVSAYRRSRRGEGARRWVYSYAYNFLVRAVFGLRVRDVNFAGKFMRSRVLDDITLESEGSFIDVELLARLVKSGATIEQFGVDYRPRSRGISTLSSIATITTIVREMVDIAPRIRTSGR